MNFFSNIIQKDIDKTDEDIKKNKERYNSSKAKFYSVKWYLYIPFIYKDNK